MRLTLSRRVRFTILGGAALFLMVVVLAAVGLVLNGRQTAIADTERQAVRFVSGAESALNRSLLGIDVLLAGMDDLLRLSTLVTEWIDEEQSSRLMRGAVNQNLLVGYLALLTPQQTVIASSDRTGKRLNVSLPNGFLADVLAQPASSLMISAPVVSFASSERVLYFARSIKLADSSKVVAVAEVRVPLLASIMSQGVDISGLEISLERADGLLLGSVPPDDNLAGKLIDPPLQSLAVSADISRAASRLTRVPAIVVARPTLYRSILIAASVPIDSALAGWQGDRNRIVTVAMVFALMILAATGLALQYLVRLGQARAEILGGKSQLEATLDAMPDSLLELGLDGRYYSSHAPHAELLAAAPELFLGGRVSDHLPPDAAEVIMSALEEAQAQGGSSGKQFALLHARGRTWFELSVARKSHSQGEAPRFIVISRDMTASKKAANDIEQLAFYDPLTQLPNRRLLMDRLQQALASSARNGRCGALLFMDLDHFKTINDTLGHDMGDTLLQQVAIRLRSCVRQADTVVRLGGDEFVVMLEDLSAEATEAAAQAELIGDKILTTLNQPYELATHRHVSTTSIGITLFNGHGQSMDTLLKQADIAMYQAKASGRNALRFFDPQMQAAISARTMLENDLREALQERQFELFYQKQVTHDGHTVGAEVLIRWKHPTRGMVPPIEFIPLTEETGLILPIGLWVLQTACAQLKAWEAHSDMSQLELAVNVSARQFRAADFVEQVAQVLQQTQANPNRLKLELTESLVLDNVTDTIVKMNALKAMGVRFSMDDFGTGQSSLSYLTQLPLDQLKIDQSFVRNIGVKPTDAVIVQTIIGMARNLGMEVIAEGVETQAQRAFLEVHGCSFCQGYLFGRPIPVNEFEQILLKEYQ
jgi:diguanylate cyclase (GGDEF)-like protein